MDKDALAKELIEARYAVLDRMVEAGWIQQMARTDSDASVLLTDKGRVLHEEILKLFNLGAPMNNAELIAFCRLIRSLEEQ